MASKLSDREYLKQLLDRMEGKTNHMKAKKIAQLFGGRLWHRFTMLNRVIAIHPQSPAEMEPPVSKAGVDGATVKKPPEVLPPAHLHQALGQLPNPSADDKASTPATPP